MAYITKNQYDTEIHPWKPFIPKKADKLLLGTFPTHPDNRKNDGFFYPNPNNDFWRIIFKTAGLDLEDSQKMNSVEFRKKVLTKLGLGIADICQRIYRQQSSSNDNAVFPVEFTNIFLLLEKHPDITTIVVTSSSKKSSALVWLHQYCSLNEKPFKIPKGTLPKKTLLNFNNKPITIEIVPSTSRQSPIRGNKLLKMYADVLLKTK